MEEERTGIGRARPTWLATVPQSDEGLNTTQELEVDLNDWLCVLSVVATIRSSGSIALNFFAALLWPSKLEIRQTESLRQQRPEPMPHLKRKLPS
mgnify:FL=1